MAIPMSPPYPFPIKGDTTLTNYAWLFAPWVKDMELRDLMIAPGRVVEILQKSATPRAHSAKPTRHGTKICTPGRSKMLDFQDSCLFVRTAPSWLLAPREVADPEQLLL